MKGAGNAAFALQLANVAQIDEVTSSRPWCAIASSTGKVSISRSAASTSARNPVLIFCGIDRLTLSLTAQRQDYA
jgi:hypothetical protein